MAGRFSSPERDLFSGHGVGDIGLQQTTLKRVQSRKKRKKAEMEEKRRLRGDSHWSKILQVNTDTHGIRHKRCVRMCRSFSLREPTGCRVGLRLNRDSVGENPVQAIASSSTETGIIATIAARLRQWLQSKRKYEVSPANEASGGERQETLAKNESGSAGGGNSTVSPKSEMMREDYLMVSHANNYHPGLKRSEACNSRGPAVEGSKSVSGISSGDLDCYTCPSTSRYLGTERTTRNIITLKSPVMDIKIEFAEQCTSVEPRSHFAANPLKLNQNQTPKTAIMTPATRALSRSQQLRQSRNKYMKLLQKTGQLSPGRSPLTGTISAPAKHGIGEKGSSPAIKRRQIKTWPLPCRKQLRTEDDDPCVGDSEMELPFMHEMNFRLTGKSSLKDFSISFDDLNLGELSRRGRRCKLYKGRWHGDVIVHVFGKLRQKDKDAFWANLSKLCRIRHENIILFMAACTSQPNLAVVTCSPQGKSLYEHIHILKEKTTMHTKVAVLRQIALGMGYLHAKGIVLRKLNTKNVFIGHKVKVSAMDFGFPDVENDRPEYGSIPRGHLTYIAPEILCTIRVIPPRLVPFSVYSPETDVFAFGTIMYEVMAGIFPFHGMLPEKIIWQICAGHRQNLHSLKCSTAIKSPKVRGELSDLAGWDLTFDLYLFHPQTLIEDCWAHEPLYRPEFRELCKDLQRHSPLHKKHSSSEPERLNKIDLLDS